MPDSLSALSIRQPWAALILLGLKTIEIRSWTTNLRGRFLLHAARLTDDRPAAWAALPPEGEKLARQQGGIVGQAEIVDVVRYDTPAAFAADQARHRNDLAWFTPGLYGFVLANATPLPFRRLPGQTRFFRVPAAEEPPRREPGMLF